jgi:CDP-diacylglycerol--glycerol-3-phosphate 3-phosphatidyltransferase
VVGAPVPGVSPTSARTLNPANGLTVMRLLLVPVFAAILLGGDPDDPARRIAAAGVFVVAVLTDRLDGDLARSRGWVTPLGIILDPIADKALIGTALVGLSLLGELPWWVTIVVLVREIGITVLRFVVIRHGVMPAGRGGKIKTALQALAITLLLLPLSGFGHTVAVWIMAVAVVVTVVTGVDYVLAAVRLRATSERTRQKRGKTGVQHRVEEAGS